jgi:hypothetical protein
MADKMIEMQVSKYFKLQKEYERIKDRLRIIEDEEAKLLDWFTDKQEEQTLAYLKGLRKQLEGEKKYTCNRLIYFIGRITSGFRKGG